MISVLLAATLLAQGQDVETFGRDVLTAGVCGSVGWEVTVAEGDRLGATVAAAHPEMTRAQFDAAAARAGEAAGQEIRAEMAGIRDADAFRVWAGAMEARCDAIAATYPTLLRRGPETAAAWDRTRTRLSARYAQ